MSPTFARPITDRWWFVLAVVLVIASLEALALLNSAEVFSSVLRDPLSDFVQPGVIIWWLVLGGPFRDLPSSPTGIAFAVATNATLWWLVLWFAAVIVRLVRRRFSAD